MYVQAIYLTMYASLHICIGPYALFFNILDLYKRAILRKCKRMKKSLRVQFASSKAALHFFSG